MSERSWMALVGRDKFDNEHSDPFRILREGAAMEKWSFVLMSEKVWEAIAAHHACRKELGQHGTPSLSLTTRWFSLKLDLGGSRVTSPSIRTLEVVLGWPKKSIVTNSLDSHDVLFKSKDGETVTAVRGCLS